MAKVKIQGHASGTGVITVTAPNTSTDRTITLPDATATIATTTDVAARLPSITDNGNATAITIDASENVDLAGANLTMTDGSLKSGVSGTFNINGATGTAGSAAYCTYGFNGDVNTGMYSGTADTIKFATGGTERMQLTSDGRGLSQFTAKFWCKFNGSGTLAVNDSHNVSSVTDVGTGDYRVNFANAMGNAHYSVHVQSQTTATWTGQWDNIHSTATSYVGFDHKEGGTNTDTSRVNVLGFGD